MCLKIDRGLEVGESELVPIWLRRWLVSEWTVGASGFGVGLNLRAKLVGLRIRGKWPTQFKSLGCLPVVGNLLHSTELPARDHSSLSLK